MNLGIDGRDAERLGKTATDMAVSGVEVRPVAADITTPAGREFGRIVNITSAVVTAPSGFMPASAGARTGMTAVMKGLARDVAKDNVTVNQLLPERIESIAAKRFGRPEELGAACAFLCSAHAGYISGQNLHVDGGSYPGLI